MEPKPQHISALTPAELKKLAPLAKTTYGALRQVASGRRQMSADMASTVERAAARIGLNLPREMHASACSKCEFARQCRKGMK